MQVIGITGQSGAGKTTVAGMRAAELSDLGFMAKLDTFILPIRIRMRECMKGFDKEKHRSVIQGYATDKRRHDPSYFVRELARRNRLGCDLDEPIADFLIVHDVRYQSEVDLCLRHGVMIYIEGTHKPLPDREANHETESHIAELFAGAEYVIAKQSNLERLAQAVKALVAAGEYLKQ